MEKYQKVISELIKFRNERDWEQFHDSKNLALAISIEASELNEIFLWKKESESENVKIEKIKEELAEKHKLDIFEIILDEIKNLTIKNILKIKPRVMQKKYNEL